MSTRWSASRRPVQGLTRAVGPNGEPVNIRKPGAYDRWHGRGGLRCFDCGEQVHPYRLANGHVWLRHKATDADQRHDATGAAGRESDEHASLAFWVYEWLHAQGLSPAYNKPIGDTRPDVRVQVGEWHVAYEVQLSAIPLEEARRRTAALKQSGHDVLWLTRNVDWVDRLPAIGLQMETEQSTTYRTTDAHGQFYSVMEGYLAWNLKLGRLAPGFRRPALETFLRSHMAHKVEWGPVQQDSYGMQNGWAAMDDWRRHTEWQARRLAEFEAQVAAYEQAARQQAALLRARETELRAAQADLQERENALQAACEQAKESDHQRSDASGEAEHWKRGLQDLVQGLHDTPIGRYALKRVERHRR